MQQLRPYPTVQAARRALDNGGRFYNLRAKAGDNIVDAVELARAAGSSSPDAIAFLHLEMALMELPAEQRTEVQSLLAPDLQEQFKAKRPRVPQPSQVESEGVAGVTAVVTGYPFFVEDKTRFQEFMVMSAPHIMMIPIGDQLDLYEVYDIPEQTGPRALVAAPRGAKRLDSSYTRLGGVLKELHFADKAGRYAGLYLEAIYYTPL
jgi:hypothetical protein